MSSAPSADGAQPPPIGDVSPTLSVIVPAYNVADTINEQLSALASQVDPGVPWEVVVVDNGSSDPTPAEVRRHLARQPTWRMVQAPREHNLAYVRNVGVDHAQGSLIAFADADDVVSPTWAGAVVRALEHHPLVAFRFDYDLLNDPAWLAGRARFQSQQVESVFGLPVVAGPMGVRRDVWQAVGGNDEAWHFTGEDFDFALRVRRDLGIEPVFAADALYHYRLRGDVAGTFRQARRYGRGHAALFARHIDRPGPLGPRAWAVGASWWWVASRAPVALADSSRRLRWARTAGVRLGRTVGSLREGRLAP